MLFDYSYRFFYEDGYGKDYKISNLAKTDDGEANNFYLLACLLMFYQQCRIFADKGGQWREFTLHRHFGCFSARRLPVARPPVRKRHKPMWFELLIFYLGRKVNSNK